MLETNKLSEKLEFVPLIGDKYNILNRCCTHKFRKRFVKCGNTVLPESFSPYLDRIRQMEIRDDDIWVVSFPKTGTTWVQEMVWCIANDLNFEAAQVHLEKRFPFLEMSIIFDEVFVDEKSNNFFLNRDINSVSYTMEMPSPRFVKTHLPFELLPKKLQNGTKAKMIYVMKNPGDTCVSFYHHMKAVEGFSSGLEDFCQLFMLGHIPYGPYWNHILGFLNRRQNQNMLILKYEDMKKDLPLSCEAVAKFIGKPLASHNMEKLMKHLSFENMKLNPAVNLVEERRILHEKLGSVLDPCTDHIRSGEVGEWIKVFKPELRERFQIWVQQNAIGTYITFN